MKWQMITYHTPSYKHLADRLVDSCHNNNIDIINYPKQNKGSWEQNCALKPGVILDAFQAIERPIVFVDADAIVHEYPALFDHITEDFAAHFRQWPRGEELLSGTLFFNKTNQAFNLIYEWVKQQEKQPGEWDQRTLHHVLKFSDTSIYELPSTYTQIFDSMKGDNPPIIEHFQESRKYRTKL